MGGPESGNFPLLYVVKMSLRNIKILIVLTDQDQIRIAGVQLGVDYLRKKIIEDLTPSI